MSLFEDERYSWRETYFVLFDPARRPVLKDLRRELRLHGGMIKVLDLKTDAVRNVTSMTIASYEDHAALEITYREGEGVVEEIASLIETLRKGSTTEEKERLARAATCRAKFDILHFEQTAGTAAFQAVKRPEMKFAPPRDPKEFQAPRTSFPKDRCSDKLGDNIGRRLRFHFDPDSYENCVNDGAGAELDRDYDNVDDSSVFERIDPNALVLVLEILCRLSNGIAIDPAGGVVI